MTSLPQKPVPIPTPDTKEFWDGCSQGILRIQKCEDCSSHVFFPTLVCQECHSDRLTWVSSSGLGEIKTFTVVRRAVGAFAPDAPYTIAIVALDEGPQLMTYIVDHKESDVAIGKRVAVAFERRMDSYLPVFKLV